MMTCTAKELCAATGGTLVQPFADSPVAREVVAKNVYLEFINQAQHRQPPGGAGLPVHPTGG